MGNCAGRILIGSGSDLVAERLPRAAALALTAATFCALFLLAALGGRALLTVVAAGAGLSIGAIAGLEPVLVADMYGLDNFGVNYSALSIPGFVMSLALGQYLPGLVYDAHVVPGTHTCLGKQCFQQTFLVLAAFSASGVLSAVLLTLRVMRAADRRALDDKLAPLNA